MGDIITSELRSGAQELGGDFCSSRALRSVFDRSGMCMACLDRGMRLIEANADFTRQFGRSHTELDGSRFCDLLHKDVQGKVSQQLTGESDLLAITRREAQEETGLPDLEPWPDAGIRHVVIVS